MRGVARGVLSTHPSRFCALPRLESEHVLGASGAEVPELGSLEDPLRSEGPRKAPVADCNSD